MHRSDSKSRAVWTRNKRFCIGHKRIRSIYSSWRTHVLWWWATKPNEYDTFPIDMKRCTQCCIISGSHTLIFIFVVCMFIGESVLVRCSNMSNSSDNIDKHNHTNGRRRTSCTETKRNEKDFSNAHRNSYERRLKQKQMTIGTHMWMRKREQDTQCE